MTPRAAIVGTGYVARVHAHALRDLGVRVALGDGVEAALEEIAQPESALA